MAKRKQKKEEQKEITLSYKDLARKRVEKQFRRRAFIAGGIIATIVTVILLVAIVSELIVKPGQTVASVNGTDISAEEFQQAVRMYRNNNLDRIYQYVQYSAILGGVDTEELNNAAAQLEDHEAVGELVLDDMIDQELIRQGAADMGLSVSEEEIERYMEEGTGYYREGTPTPLPTNTPFPTPTPITETLVTAVPTRTPQPSPTLVTEDAFETMYQERIDGLKSVGIREETLRGDIEFQLLLDKVYDELMKDTPKEADQVELNVLTFTDQDTAAEYHFRLQAGEGFEDLMADARAVPTDTVESTTIAWAPRESLSERYGEETTDTVFDLEVGEYTDVIISQDGVYIIFEVSGHEVKELSDSTLQALEQSLFNDWLAELQALAEIEKYDDVWRNRIPQEPELNQLYLQSLIEQAVGTQGQ